MQAVRVVRQSRSALRRPTKRASPIRSGLIIQGHRTAALIRRATSSTRLWVSFSMVRSKSLTLRLMEDVQYLAGHSNPRTTQIYDLKRRRVTRNIVERISV